MTGEAEGGPGTGPALRLSPATRQDIKSIAHWISLGASAGGLGGVLVGGIGGRFAMFVLRLTSDDSVRGIESDDGFTIGQFNTLETLELIVVTAILGIIVGLIVVLGRPFFPKRGMPFAWALAGATAGGAMLINPDGVDFTLIEPHWLAVTFFVAIPAAGAGLIAWLTEAYARFWWRKRKVTALAALVALAAIPAFPVAIVAVLVGAFWFLAMRVPLFRALPEQRGIQVAAILVFGLVVAIGAFNLTGDVREII